MAGMGSKVLFGFLLAGGAAWKLKKVSDFGHHGVDLLPVREIETRPNDTSEGGEARVGGGGGGSSSDAELSASRPRREKLPHPKWGNHITVLSIDGGGIRGLIPAVVLGALERNLQEVEKEEDPNGDWEDARIADYFDVIAGTSTGGLIAAMLTTPYKNTGRPKLAAGEIEGHYCKIGPKIFTPRGQGLSHAWNRFFSGPDYDSTFLYDEIEEITGAKTLADTLANVVIPTFDVRRLTPIIFSSYQPPYYPLPGKPEERKDNLSDVCKGTSAAPTYFRAHYFHGVNEDERPRKGDEFHLIDGGVGANNPTMAAIMRITREVVCQTDNEDYIGFANKKKITDDFKPELKYKDLVVISLGTGSTREADRAAYKAEVCANWGAIGWIYNKVECSDKCRSTAIAGWIPGTEEDRERWGLIGRILNKVEDYNKLIHKYKEHRTRKPIIDMLMHANDVLVDFNVAMLLRSQGCKHYLRIQTEVEEKNLSMDDVTETNMQELTNIGRQLLKKNVSRVNAVTGRYQEVRPDAKQTKVPTNEEELKRFAETLCEERKRRLNNRSAAEGVKPTP